MFLADTLIELITGAILFTCHTAYNVIFSSVLYVFPALYFTIISVLLVVHPKNVYPSLVGIVVLKVISCPFIFVCVAGAPSPPLAL